MKLITVICTENSIGQFHEADLDLTDSHNKFWKIWLQRGPIHVQGPRLQHSQFKFSLMVYQLIMFSNQVIFIIYLIKNKLRSKNLHYKFSESRLKVVG